MDAALKPYDWYHALVLAGAEEHGLPNDHIELLRTSEFLPDTDLSRKGRRDALIALDKAGYPHGLSYPPGCAP